MKPSNEIIARFMGGQHESRNITTIGGLRTGKWTFDDNIWCYDDQLDYDNRWDRLMPVIEKIENIEGVTTIFKNTRFQIKYEKKTFSCHTIVKINSAYRVVVEFITWYNSQNPKPSFFSYSRFCIR